MPTIPPLRGATAPADPVELLLAWTGQVMQRTGRDEVAMTLATVDDQGNPDARVVALRRLGRGGLEYSTDARSHKARQLEQRPGAVLVGYWPEEARQVRLHGRVERLPDEAADEVFATRPRRSQLGAWANHQSAPVADRHALVSGMEAVERRFADEPQVPRPPHWIVHRFRADRVEFWQAADDRLHDRLAYVRQGAGWRRSRLQP